MGALDRMKKAVGADNRKISALSVTPVSQPEEDGALARMGKAVKREAKNTTPARASSNGYVSMADLNRETNGGTLDAIRTALGGAKAAVRNNMTVTETPDKPIQFGEYAADRASERLLQTNPGKYNERTQRDESGLHRAIGGVESGLAGLMANSPKLQINYEEPMTQRPDVNLVDEWQKRQERPQPTLTPVEKEKPDFQQVIDNVAPVNPVTEQVPQGVLDNAAKLRELSQKNYEIASEGDKDYRARDALRTAEKYGENVYDDNLTGLAKSNYSAGRLSQDSSYAWNEFVNNPTEENRAIAMLYDAALSNASEINQDAMTPDGTFETWVRSASNYAPQLLDQMSARIKGGIAGGAAGSFIPGIGTMTGIAQGQSVASAVDMYAITRGAAFKGLLDAGVPEDKALKMAKDEALISSIIEYADSLAEFAFLGGKDIIKLLLGGGADMAGTTAGKAAGKAALKKILAYAGNIIQEGEEERSQEAVSIANERRGLSGDDTSLAKSALDVYINEGLRGKGEDHDRMAEAATEGRRIAAMFGAVQAGTGFAADVAGNRYGTQQGYEALSRAQQEYTDTGAVSDRTARDIARNLPASSVLQNSGAVVMTDDMTREQRAEAAKKGVGTLMGEQEQFVERVNAEPQVEVKRETLPVTRNLTEQQIDADIRSANQAAATLGRSGAKAFEYAYDRSTAQNISPEKAFEGYAKVYNAALKGQEVPDVSIPQVLRVAAENAGKNDARDAAQAKFFGANAGLAKNRSGFPRNLTSKDERLLDAIGKAAGIQIKFADTLAVRDKNGVFYNNAMMSNDGVLTIAKDASDPVRAALTHEVVHRLRQTSPEAYQMLAQFVKDNMSDERFASALRERAKNYGGMSGYTVSDFTEETIADAFGTVLGNKDLLEKIVNTDRTAAQKMLDAVHDLIVKVKRALTGEKEAQLDESKVEAFRDLQGKAEEMAKLLGDALEKVKSAEHTESAATDGGAVRYSIKTVDGKLMAVIDSEPDTTTKKAAKEYLDTLVDTEHPFATILADAQPVYLGEDFPGEYVFADDTRFSEFSNMQTKMRAATNLDEMLLLAENGDWKENGKEKHNVDAKNGWYRYDIEFAAGDDSEGYTIYTGTLLIRNDADGKSYLYDLLDVNEKKKIPAPNPSQSGMLLGQETEGSGIGLAPDRAPKESSSGENISQADEKVKRDLRYSRKADADYMKAVESGDTDTAQRMVDEAAKAAGYSVKVYHGTPSFGFTQPRGVLFATDSKETAGTYSGTTDARRINDAGDSSLGMYQLYAKTDGMMDLDADGMETNHIALGRHEAEFNNSQAFKSWRTHATINQLIKYAKENGYTGVIVKNVVDSATPQSRRTIGPATDYVFFDPKSQVKSADPVTYDDNGNVISLSDRFNAKNNDVRFSMRRPLEETDRFIALHNMNEEALRGALELGGMAMPSVALVRSESGHDTYGPISAVFGKDSVSPTDRRNKIFSGDAYTPTFPEVGLKISEKAANAADEKIESLMKEAGVRDEFSPSLDTDNLRDQIQRYGSFEKAYGDKDYMKLAFLLDTGRSIKIPMQEKVYTSRADIATLRKVAEAIDLDAAYNGDLMQYEPVVRELVREYAVKHYGQQVADKLRPADKELSYSDVDSVIHAARDLRWRGKTEQVDKKALEDRIESAMKTKKVQAEYSAWLNEMGKDMVEKRGIRNNRDFFSPSGNRRSFEQLYYDYTLANIVKAMQEERQQGKTTFLTGSGNIRGAAAKSYGTIEEARKDIGRIRNMAMEETLDEEIKAFDEKCRDLCIRMTEGRGHNSFGAAIDAAEVLTETLSKYKTADQIYRYWQREYGGSGYYDMSREIAEEAAALVKEAQNLPTSYLEAKLYRAVPMDEPLAYVVPRNMNKDLLQQMKDAGLNVITYKPNDSADRLKKINSVEGARFSRKSSGDTREADLMRQNDQLREQIDYWKSQLKRSEPAGKVDPKAVRTAARNLIEAYGSTLRTDEIADDLQKLYDFMGTGNNENGELSYEAARDIANGIAEKLAESALDDTESAYNTYEELRKFLRTMDLTLSQRDIANVEDYGDFRKRNMGRLNLKRGEMSNIDRIYDELSDKWPEFFPGDVISVDDQLTRMADVADFIYNDRGHNPFDPYMEQAVIDIGNDIMDRFFDLPQAKTFADKQAAKIESMRIRMSELRRQSEERLHESRAQARADRNERIQEVKDHYAEIAQRRREQKLNSKERNRLLHIARRLSNKKLSAVNRALLDEYIGDLDLVAKSMTGKTLEKLTDLRDWYFDQRDNNPDFISDPHIEKLIERLSKRQIKDLTNEEVRELTDVLLNIENEIRTQNKLIDSQDKHDTYMAGMRSIQDIENSRGLQENLGGTLDKLFVNNTLSPTREMHRLTGYTDGDPLYILTNELADGQRKMFDYQRRASEKFLKWTEDKKLVDRIRGKNAEEIKITGIGRDGPTEVTITPAMRMSLYLHSLNDQNLRHIAGGGITVPDFNLYKQGKIAEAYDRGTNIKLTPSQVRSITANMTAEERAFAEAARNYFNGMSREAVNETSEKLKGYSLAGVENYFPIDTDKSFVKKDFDTLKFDGTLEGMGFLKERINSSSPIMLYDMDNVLRRSIEQHAKYYGLAIPVRNFSKVWGVTKNSYDQDGNRTGFESSVQQAMKRKWGSAGYKYIEKMMGDLQNGNVGEQNEWENLLRKVRSNYAGAVLTLNASVAMKQAASYPTAAAVVGWGPLMKALGNVGKVDLDTVNKYTPLLWYRTQGFSTQELGDMAKQDKQLPKMLNWVQGMDVITTRKLWKAAEYYVRDNQDLRVGSEEYYKAVADVYNKIIEETQPNYTTMQRPQLLRSNNGIMQSLMMFRTQPFQNFNVLYDAMGNLQAKKRAAQTGGPEAQAAYKIAKKEAGWAVTSQVVQLAVFAGMTAAWAGLRGKTDKYEDDEGEITTESVLKRIGRDMIGGASSMIPFGSDFWEFASSKLFNEKYYGFDEVTSSAINDMLTALSKGGKTLADTAKSIVAGEEIDAKALRVDMDSVLKAVSKVAGVPYENIENLFNMAYKRAATAVGGKYEGEYAYLRLTTKTSDTGAYYDNLYGAYKNDKAAYEKIYSSMLENGFDEGKIKDAMEKRMKKDEGVDSVKDLDERYMTPTQQAKYDSNLQRMQSSSVWSSASDEQRDKALDMLYGVTVNNSDTKNIRGKIEGGASVGIDETEYLLYKVALMMADTNNNGPDQKESEAAVEMMTGLTRDEKSYLWASPNKTWADSKNNPYKTTQQKAAPTIETADVSGSSAIRKAQYDPATRTATITWSGGGTYTYNVSPSEWEKFKDSPSKGSVANGWK